MHHFTLKIYTMRTNFVHGLISILRSLLCIPNTRSSQFLSMDLSATSAGLCWSIDRASIAVKYFMQRHRLLHCPLSRHEMERCININKSDMHICHSQLTPWAYAQLLSPSAISSMFCQILSRSIMLLIFYITLSWHPRWTYGFRTSSIGRFIQWDSILNIPFVYCCLNELFEKVVTAQQRT